MNRVLASMTVALWSLSTPLLGATAYVAMPLGSIGGLTTYGTAIDASGRVAGFGDTTAAGASSRHAFLFTSTIQNLGTLNGGTQSFGEAINDQGEVAGLSNAGGGASFRAVIFRSGVTVDLNALFGGTASTAYGINNAGDVVGGVTSAGAQRAYLYRAASNTFATLGTFGGNTSQAYAVNVFGEVTGYAHVPSSDAHAFRYNSGGLVDLGTLGGPASIGFGINAAGHVVGSAALPSASFHAFFHDGASMIDLGTLGGTESKASAINAADVIVGEASDATGALRAFVYADGAMTDLNAVTSGLGGFVLTTATAINDAGQIVAMSCTGPIVCPRAYRLDPVPAPKVAAIEYHHAAFDHYFSTAIADEIAKLDNGTFAGWSRTGASFNVYTADQVGTSPVCRFFSTAFAPKSSHFYTPYASECVNVQRNPDWQFEGRVYNLGLPDANGNCAAGTDPVYRLYNNGQGDAPNHRFTTSLATRAAMIGQGWILEGNGPNAVAMCAPQ